MSYESSGQGSDQRRNAQGKGYLWMVTLISGVIMGAVGMFVVVSCNASRYDVAFAAKQKTRTEESRKAGFAEGKTQGISLGKSQQWQTDSVAYAKEKADAARKAAAKMQAWLSKRKPENYNVAWGDDGQVHTTTARFDSSKMRVVKK